MALEEEEATLLFVSFLRRHAPSFQTQYSATFTWLPVVGYK